MTDPFSVRRIVAFMLDMDGVIYRGQDVLPGAPEFVDRLHAEKVPFLYLTNNSTTPPDQVAARLAQMGIHADPSEVLTSAEATASALAREKPGCRVLVVGEAGIRTALASAGFLLVDDHREADAVVVGLDRQCTYATLREAALAIRRGAAFIATNTDRTLPTELGLIPGAGALVGALELATDVVPRVIGKPSPEIFRFALARLGSPTEETAVIGDRTDTDVTGGQRAGMPTIAVLTGVGTRRDFEAMERPPDWIFEDLNELSRAYFRPARAGS